VKTEAWKPGEGSDLGKESGMVSLFALGIYFSLIIYEKKKK
jgi:hypothetical protein